MVQVRDAVIYSAYSNVRGRIGNRNLYVKTTMAHLRLLLIASLFVTRLTLAQTGYEVQYIDLKGKVKSVRENSFAAKGKNENVRKGKPKWEYSGQHDYFVEFDVHGQKIYKAVYDKGAIIRTLTYTYDSLGYLTKETRRNDKGIATDSTLITNVLNGAGKPIKRISRFSDQPTIVEFLYTYDSIGNTHARYRRIAPDSTVLKESAEYDPKWRITKSWVYDLKGNIFSTVEYTYGESGKRTSETFRDKKGAIMIIYRWKYETNGILERREACGPSGQNCEAWTFKYEFDSTGNWIKVIEYRNGKPVFIKERTITYW